MTRSLLLLALMLSAHSVAAQTSFSFGLFVGSNEFDEEFGRELFVGGTAGAAYATGALLLTADLEGDLVTRDDPDSPYRFDSSVDRCRDRRSGQFVSSSLCGGGVFGGAVNADANLLVPGVDGLSIGAGYRLGSGSTPYAAVGYALGGYQASTIRFKLQGSHKLVSFGALFQFGR